MYLLIPDIRVISRTRGTSEDIYTQITDLEENCLKNACYGREERGTDELQLQFRTLVTAKIQAGISSKK